MIIGGKLDTKRQKSEVNVLYLDCDVGCKLYTFDKTHRTVHTKGGVTLYKLSFNKHDFF